MKLILKREPSTKISTPGILYKEKDGRRSFLCYTLEDIVRDEKVHGKTAIPAGVYSLRISRSFRFKRDLPEVMNVPNYAGVRIHGGNTHENTEGCPLVGIVRDHKDRISQCAPAVGLVMKAIADGYNTLEVMPS